MAKATGAGAKNPPNIRLAKGAQPLTVDGEVNIGGRETPIMLPSQEAQRKGFYLDPEEARLIILIGGGAYIPYVELGAGGNGQ
jgi:hypothetical protein